MSREHNPMTRDLGRRMADTAPSHRTCQWIEGHGKDKAFTCSAGTIEGSSYCQEHHRRVYTAYVPDWLNMKLGRIIANARSRHGATLQDLSEETGISRSNIQKIETGTVAEPGFRVIAKLGRALNLSLDDLADEDAKWEKP